MESSRTDVLIRAFAEVARERLLEREVVPLPGVGTLRVEHEASRSRETDGGLKELLPPRDVVVFDSDEST